MNKMNNMNKIILNKLNNIIYKVKNVLVTKKNAKNILSTKNNDFWLNLKLKL